MSKIHNNSRLGDYYIMNNSKLLINPIMTVWEVTLKCNLKCLHCGSSAGVKNSNELTTKESLKVCKELSEIGFKGISLMGGELFLREDWEVISKEIKDRGMTLSIITNGFFHPNKIIPRLSKLKTDYVMVGLDGGSAIIHDKIRGVKGSFKKAISFIKETKEANIPIGIITSFHKLNFYELRKIYNFVINKEIDWQIQMALPFGRFPKKLMLSDEEYYSLGMFLKYLKKKHEKDILSIFGTHNFGFNSDIIPNFDQNFQWNGCLAGINVLGIQSNGNIKGCNTLSDEYIEGNVREKSIIDIWNNSNAFNYNRKFKKEDLAENCIRCKYNESCKGGCTTRSILLTNKLHNDPMCFYRFEKNVFI